MKCLISSNLRHLICLFIVFNVQYHIRGTHRTVNFLQGKAANLLLGKTFPGTAASSSHHFCSFIRTIATERLPCSTPGLEMNWLLNNPHSGDRWHVCSPLSAPHSYVTLVSCFKHISKFSYP